MFCFKELPNPKAKFCNSAHKMSFRRGSKSENKTVTIIEETVTNNRNKEPIIVTEVKTVTSPEKKLIFTDKQKLEERIEIYKEMFKDHTFIPNWILQGWNSREEAIKDVLKIVRGTEKL